MTLSEGYFNGLTDSAVPLDNRARSSRCCAVRLSKDCGEHCDLLGKQLDLMQGMQGIKRRPSPASNGPLSFLEEQIRRCRSIDESNVILKRIHCALYLVINISFLVNYERSLFSIILLATTYRASAEPCMVIFEHGQLIALPAAVTQADQVKGMSGDNSSTGRILAWKTAEPRAVWMKDTSNPAYSGVHRC